MLSQCRFNPHNLRDAKWGSAKVAAAGPLANLILAVLFGSILRFAPALKSSLGNFYFVYSYY